MPDTDLLLDLHEIRRSFGSFEALRGITLQLRPGRIGLLGPNGAGKSTLLKLLMGLLAPTSGTGTVLGHTLGTVGRTQSSWQLRRLIGFMPEAEALVPGLTGIEYVALAGELYGMDRRQAARRADEVLSDLELGEARYRRVEQYSAGMKQRVKLAQALVHDPPALLLDEPTSGLDPAGRDTMLRLIRELGSVYGKSVILSTHLLADVQTVCDQVVILMKGQVTRAGTVAEICQVQESRYRLKAHGNEDALRGALRVAGVEFESESNRGEWLVRVPPDWVPARFFELALASGATLQTMVPHQESLTDAFFKVMG